MCDTIYVYGYIYLTNWMISEHVAGSHVLLHVSHDTKKNTSCLTFYCFFFFLLLFDMHDM